jgi:hypothetical protein
MTIRNPAVDGRTMLAAMYRDEYFPRFLVDKLRAILLQVCEQIEHEKPTSEEGLYAITHAAVERINELQEEFEENDSDIETGAREALGAEFDFIVKAYGFASVDIEDVIAPRDW